MGKRMKTFLIMLALSVFSIGILSIRVIFAGKITFIFLVWNLILAWIPFLISNWIFKLHQNKTKPVFLWFIIFIWYIFFPNAPYILTDLIHLRIVSRIPLWYDGLLIFSFSFTGLVLGFLSLNNIQNIISEKYGKIKGWIFTAFFIFSSGFGIYLGRFLRWNSWDIVSNPKFLFKDILERIINPFSHPKTVAVTILFSTFIFLSYLIFTNKQRQN